VVHLDAGLPPEVYPLAWLVGTWRGEGTVAYQGIEPARILSEVAITNDAGPYLTYRATTWHLGPLSDSPTAHDDGPHPAQPDPLPAASRPSPPPDPPWHTESGYWRIPPGQADETGAPRTAPPFEVEVLIADPSGYVTVYLGEADGPRITLASDLVARTANGAEVAAARRLYGLVEGDLLWAWDVAAFGHPLASYLAARLTRQLTQ